MSKEAPWSRITSLKKRKDEYLAEFERRLIEGVISKLRNELKNRDLLYKDEILTLTGSTQADEVFKACSTFKPVI